MNILILEDEPLVAENLVAQVKKIRPESTIDGPLTSVREARQYFQENPLPDLILADIQLSDGISLELFSMTQASCPVIFTTAFNEYAIRAFKINSIDYLLKPIQFAELQAAFGKFDTIQQKYKNKDYLEALASYIENRKHDRKFKESFIVHQGNAAYLIEEKEIACFMKDDLIFLIKTDGHKWVTEYRSLEEIAEVVDPAHYFRANRQYLVCRKSISGYKTDHTGKLTLTLKNGLKDPITISKEKAAEFKHWLERV